MLKESVLTFLALFFLASQAAAQSCPKADKCQQICKQHDDLSQEGCNKLCIQMACSQTADDWTVSSEPKTEKPKVSPDDFTFQPSDRVCTDKLKSRCKEDCRFEFGQKFHDCNFNCLTSLCKVNKTSDKDSSSNDPRQARFCLELESEGCLEECKDGSRSTKARCRRTCLQNKCPDAHDSDAAEEAMDPGTIGCSRCKEKSMFDCQTLCTQPSRSSSSLRYSAFGCRKICQLSRCHDKCSLVGP